MMVLLWFLWCKPSRLSLTHIYKGICILKLAPYWVQRDILFVAALLSLLSLLTAPSPPPQRQERIFSS
jgi:hypothetical protein